MIQPESHQDGNEHHRQDESDLPAEEEIRIELGLKGADEMNELDCKYDFCLLIVCDSTHLMQYLCFCFQVPQSP